MGRKKRKWYKGAIYHITARGNRRLALFIDDADRLEYLRLLREVQLRKPFCLHSYCLMTNHIHLQLEPLMDPPGSIMKHLHTKYAKYFNKKYGFTGHVFEARYGAELLGTAEYEVEVSKYIHLNPIRADIVTDLRDYPWSSYHHYLGDASSTLVTTERIFQFIAKPKKENYLKFLQADLHQGKQYLQL